MRRILPLLVLALTGCSNAPIAGFLDTCFPSRARASADRIPPPNLDDRPPPKVDPIIPGPGPIPPGPAPGPNTGPLPPPNFGP
jgi:hypothetical protein